MACSLHKARKQKKFVRGPTVHMRLLNRDQPLIDLPGSR